MKISSEDIAEEKAGSNHYKAMAKDCDNPAHKKMLLGMAKDEARHRQNLIKMKSSKK